jgi:hypothetical protein
MLTVVAKDSSQVAVVRMEWSHCDALTGLLIGAARRFASYQHNDGTPVRAAGVRSSLDPNPALLRKDLASIT